MNRNQQPTLFPAEGRYVLWGRETTRHRWRAIGSADSAAEAWELIERSGIKGGDWMVREDGTDPNENRS